MLFRSIELLSPFYRNLYDEMGEKVMLDIYNSYRGLTVNIPQKLYDPNKVREYIAFNYKEGSLSKKDMKKLVNQFGYSERHIYRMVKNNDKA